MKKSLFILTCVILLTSCAHSIAPKRGVRVVLVGDSTMATASGWGDAFCKRATSKVTCINLAKGGRSSKSYRAEGSWDKVLELLAHKGAWSRTYVFVQFGHNDQPGKAERATDLATEFIPNIERYVTEIRAAGAEPVLITPLTRRSFKNFLLQDALSPWAAATRKAAFNTHTPLLDLASDSVFAVQTMGPVKSLSLAQVPPTQALIDAAATGTTIEAPKPEASDGRVYFDYTHIGPRGAEIFATIVVEELRREIPELRNFF